MGTEFSIYLPAAPVQQSDSADKEKEGPPSGRGETVLVVDDEAAICQLTRQNLEAHPRDRTRG